MFQTQTITVDDLRALSQRVSVLAYQQLRANRLDPAKGFEAYIHDLADSKNDKTGAGWCLVKGVVKVQLHHDADELMNYLEEKLAHYPWFEKRDIRVNIEKKRQLNELIVPGNCEALTETFKILGRWEDGNPAVDIVPVLISNTGKIFIQVIIRPHDKKYAFVGGMADNKAVNKDEDLDRVKKFKIELCIEESLEERYSGDFFTQGSLTLIEASKIPVAQRLAGFKSALEDVFKDKHFEVLRNNHLPGLLDAIQKQQGQFAHELRAVEEAMDQKLLGQPLGHGKVSVDDIKHYKCLLKCALYKAYFPAQHQAYMQFVKLRVIALNSTPVEADPRNTKVSYMTTTPHYYVLNQEEMEKHERSWFLQAKKGGDDAAGVKTIEVEKLFEQGMFASHERILLDILVDAFVNDKALKNRLNEPAIQTQFLGIKQHIERREIARNNFSVPKTGTVVFQTIPPVVQHSANNNSSNNNNNNSVSNNNLSQINTQQTHTLAILSSTEAINQYNNATTIAIAALEQVIGQAVDRREITTADTVMEAHNKLISLLGTARVDRISAELEARALPHNYKVILVDLVEKYNEIVFLIDNSGSMQLEMDVVEPSGVVVRMTRWNNMLQRLKCLVPFLGMAGRQVNIQFLNPLEGALGSANDSLHAHTCYEGAICSEHGYRWSSHRGNNTYKNYKFDFSVKKCLNNSIDPSDLKCYEKTLVVLEKYFLPALAACVPAGGTHVSTPLGLITDSCNESHRKLIVHITDGNPDPNDLKPVQKLIKERLNPQCSPIVVVACTDEREQLTWGRALEAEGQFSANGLKISPYCFKMLEDYSFERKRIAAMHGKLVPYPSVVWIAAHLVASTGSQNLSDYPGFYKYSILTALDRPLTEDELTELLGYTATPAMHVEYCRSRAESIQQPQQQSSAQAKEWAERLQSTNQQSSYLAVVPPIVNTGPLPLIPGYGTQQNQQSAHYHQQGSNNQQPAYRP